MAALIEKHADDRWRSSLRAAWRGFLYGSFATALLSLLTAIFIGPFAILVALLSFPFGGLMGAVVTMTCQTLSVPHPAASGPWDDPTPPEASPKSAESRSELLRRIATGRDDLPPA